MADPPLLSVVIPVFFEEDCIARCVSDTKAVLEREGNRFEIVFVDDGSTDRTLEILRKLAGADSRLKLVELSFNHGKATALTAGIRYARGEYVLCMDPDLQDPPEEIPRFLAAIRERKCDLVFGVREEPAGSLLHRIASGGFWRVFALLTNLDLPRNLAAMRILSRKFADRLLEYPEANRFLEGLFLHVGLRRDVLVIAHQERAAGRSKYTLRRKLSLAFQAICDYSDVPLKLATRVGMLLVGISVLAAATIVVLRLFVMEFQLGWPSLYVLLLLGFGLQIFFLGIVGKYVGNIYRESKRRPLFSVRETTNLDRQE